VQPWGVTCRDATARPAVWPARVSGGWPLKPYAIINSRFAEVLLLDADNVPVRNPESLFDHPWFERDGAMLWPDLGRLPPAAPAWRLFDVGCHDEPEVESGQVLVDKRRCWAPMLLCMWYNENHAVFYKHVHGDKETFHFAFHRLGAPHALIPHRWRSSRARSISTPRMASGCSSTGTATSGTCAAATCTSRTSNTNRSAGVPAGAGGAVGWADRVVESGPGRDGARRPGPERPASEAGGRPGLLSRPRRPARGDLAPARGGWLAGGVGVGDDGRGPVQAPGGPADAHRLARPADRPGRRPGLRAVFGGRPGFQSSPPRNLRRWGPLTRRELDIGGLCNLGAANSPGTFRATPA